MDGAPINIDHTQISFANSSLADVTTEHKQKSLHIETKTFQEYVPTQSVLTAQIKQQESIDNRFKVINDRLAQEPTKSVIDVMETLFDEEPIDFVWAKENEENIYHFFRDGNTFKKFSPESVDCKSSSCKVIISAPDKISGIEIQDSISRQLSLASSEMLSSYSAGVDENSAKLTIFFQKNEI